MSFTFAVGDIHGCLRQLEAMLRWIEPYGRGTVIFLGDYVDRGPNSRGVVERLIAGPRSLEWKWIALKGNHEDMMVGAMEGRYEESWWVANGGIETVESYGGLIPQAHLDWADTLPLILNACGRCKKKLGGKLISGGRQPAQSRGCHLGWRSTVAAWPAGLSSFEELFEFVGCYALILDDNHLCRLECVLELTNFKRQGLDL